MRYKKISPREYEALKKKLKIMKLKFVKKNLEMKQVKAKACHKMAKQRLKVAVEKRKVAEGRKISKALANTFEFVNYILTLETDTYII